MLNDQRKYEVKLKYDFLAQYDHIHNILNLKHYHKYYVDTFQVWRHFFLN